MSKRNCTKWRGCLMSQKSLREARYLESIQNSRINRGEAKGYVSFLQCGCRNRDCGAFTVIKEYIPKPKEKEQILDSRICPHFKGKVT